jgi:hypothetical protein
LLLLVEDDATAPDGLAIIEQFIPVAPAMTTEAIDRTGPREEVSRRMRARHQLRMRAWIAALEDNAEYQRFIARQE